MPAPDEALVDAVSRRFAPAGPFARYYARGKLRHDPIYLGLLASGVIPDGARLLDLGCGQGILLALLVAARDAARAGAWPAGWPAPPADLELRGFERAPSEVRRARLALGRDAVIEARDVRDAPLPESDLIALVDVIHYLEPAAQERLLARAAGALAPGGLLLLRVCDAEAGVAALLTRLGDHAGALSRQGRITRLHLRSAAEWIALLERLGWSVRTVPIRPGRASANVLLSARRGAAA